MAAAGLNDATISRVLKNQRTGTRQEDITSAIRQANTWRQRLAAVTAQGPNARVPRDQTLLNPTIHSAYRYGVQVTFTNEAGDTTGGWTVYVTSNRNLTLAQIIAEAQTTLTARTEQYPRLRNWIETMDVSIDLQTAERRTG